MSLESSGGGQLQYRVNQDIQIVTTVYQVVVKVGNLWRGKPEMHIRYRDKLDQYHMEVILDELHID